MQRFYYSSSLSVDLELTDQDIVHQLTRVLRVNIGDEVTLFDGDESETIYEIIKITKKSLSLRGKNRIFPNTEPKAKMSLYQALPNKLEKIEYIIQKGVEVGIKKFIFFRSDFSQKLILSESKKTRLLSIAKEAVEQCGGLLLPEILFVESMPAFPEGQNLLLDTLGKVLKVSEIVRNPYMSIWIGPEGGWSPKEREKMKQNSFIFVRFGERVLRTETAGVVVAFALLNA